jgi:sulfite exporter TauE/SafE
MSGLLPCGWLYAYVLIAASTQNPLSGVIIMGVFWLGTVPALIIFARILKKLNSIWLKRIPKITALIIILLGLMTISGRVSMIEESNSGNKTATMSCH